MDTIFFYTNIHNKKRGFMNLETITREDLKNNYSLYQKMLKVLEFVDGVKPEGTCCGRGKENAINKFIDNREKYVERMNAIKNRKIKPLFSGALYFSAVKKRYYAERLTDADSLFLIENGYVNFFDMSEYEAQSEEKVEEIKEDYNKYIEGLRTQKTEPKNEESEAGDSIPEGVGAAVSLDEVNKQIDDEIKPSRKSTRKRKTKKSK